ARRQSPKSIHETVRLPCCSRYSSTTTSRSEAGKGSAFSSTVSITLNIAVFAPMPSVSVINASTVKPGSPRAIRHACLTSSPTLCQVAFIATHNRRTQRHDARLRTRHKMSFMRQNPPERLLVRENDPRSGVSVSTLAREYPRGFHVRPHAHASDQLMYAGTG